MVGGEKKEQKKGKPYFYLGMNPRIARVPANPRFFFGHRAMTFFHLSIEAQLKNTLLINSEDELSFNQNEKGIPEKRGERRRKKENQRGRRREREKWIDRSGHPAK